MGAYTVDDTSSFATDIVCQSGSTKYEFWGDTIHTVECLPTHIQEVVSVPVDISMTPPVPEPATYVLTLLGILGVCLFRKLRQ